MGTLAVKMLPQLLEEAGFPVRAHAFGKRFAFGVGFLER